MQLFQFALSYCEFLKSSFIMMLHYPSVACSGSQQLLGPNRNVNSHSFVYGEYLPFTKNCESVNTGASTAMYQISHTHLPISQSTKADCMYAYKGCINSPSSFLISFSSRAMASSAKIPYQRILRQQTTTVLESR